MGFLPVADSHSKSKYSVKSNASSGLPGLPGYDFSHFILVNQLLRRGCRGFSVLFPKKLPEKNHRGFAPMMLDFSSVLEIFLAICKIPRQPRQPRQSV